MLSAKPALLRKRYGKAHGPQDHADRVIVEEGLRQLREHPESAIPIKDIKRRYGIK